MSDRKVGLFGLFRRLGRRHKSRRRLPALAPNRSQLEALEPRCMLAVSGGVPSIQGTVFLDSNGNSVVDPGEEIAGASVQLFLDNGDGIFDPDGGDVQVGPDEVTDVDGEYLFDPVDNASNYFVVQPAQTVSGITLDEQVSGLIQPGLPNLIIDEFQTNQEVMASPPPPSADSSTLSFADESEVIGAERDMFVELISGVGEVQLLVNPFNLLEVLQFNSSSGVQGSAIITWDGQDGDASPIPSMGLGGRDLTQGGVNTGFAMMVGIDTAGMGDALTVSIFQGDASNVSSVSTEIPVTDGTATAFLFIPFSDFTGPVSPSDVDAIQMTFGAVSVPSADGQVAFVGILGPKVFDIANAGGADLSVSKSNATTTVVPGETVSYSITVENLGPLDAVGATVADVFPSELTSVAYTSATSGSVTGNTPAGNGDINDVIDITVGSSVTYSVTADIDPDATGALVNTATVEPPAGTIDPDPGNNADTETDTLTPQIDLQISKTNDLDEVHPGESVDYTITVINAGPSSVVGADVNDTFPAELTNVTYTSSTFGGIVSGNTPNGTGPINDTVDMTPGSSIVYQVTGTLSDTDVNLLSNTATVTEPDGTVELDPSNNTSTHTDPVVRQVDLAISKTNTTTAAAPGQPLTYEIVVQNLGPSDAVGAVVQDTFPTNLQNVSYTSTAAGGATGNTNGNGDIADLVDMPFGSTITYTVSAIVTPDATGQVENTATVVPPQDLVDTNPDNNTDTEIDTIVPTVDLAVTKTDNVSVVRPNDVLTYEIVVSNLGPSDATGATFNDLFPTELTNISYTSSVQGGASGNTPNGTGNLNETLNLPNGSSVTYLVSATVRETAAVDISNTASVAPPAGTIDSNPDNNSATDVDTLLPGVDLAITKTNNTDVVFAGEDTTYTIIVTNNGPNGVVGAEVIDLFPTEVTTVSYTSVVSGGATGNTNGSGDISDTVNMPASSRITYTVVAAIDALAAGQLVNRATVQTPNDFTELNPSNNSSTDTDRIDQALAQISGFVYIDLNDDGVRDPNESGLSGVEILLEQDDTELRNTFTDSDGSYRFPSLDADVYDVVEIQPEGFRNGKLTVGGGIGAVTGDNRFTVPLQPGDNATELNFGELIVRPSKRSLLASRFR